VAKKKAYYESHEYWVVADARLSDEAHKKLWYGHGSIVIINPSGGTGTNPFTANGTAGGIGSGATIYVWLTDQDGNQTYGTATLTAPPPPPPPAPWTWQTTSFPTVPGGDYYFSVQIQYNNQYFTTTINVTLPDPP
jgi:hypothetical protein